MGINNIHYTQSHKGLLVIKALITDSIIDRRKWSTVISFL